MHNRSTVWDGAAQQILHDMVRFCDERCIIGFFVLLSCVTRLSLLRSDEKRDSSMHTAAHERQGDSDNRFVP